MATFNLRYAQTHLSSLVDRAGAGEEIVIRTAGKPVAKLVPLKAVRTGPRPLGLLAGKVKIPDDFDAPLPDDILDLFYNGPIFPDEPR